MSCVQKWQDVFVTKADYGFDDTFICTVHSVDLDTATGTKATIVPYNTEYIMPVFKSYDADNSAYKDSIYSVKEGDLIRIGGPANMLSTNYLTILEVIDVAEIHNSLKTSYVYSIQTDATHGDYAALPTLTGGDPLNPTSSLPYKPNNALKKVFRINSRINTTILPGDLVSPIAFAGGNVTFEDGLDSYTENKQLEELSAKKASIRRHVSSQMDPHEGYFYGMYKCNRFDLSDGNVLKIRFDNSIKSISCIKLIAYQLANKRQHGMTHGNEFVADDYFILHIDELHGSVISNNHHAHGSFAVLMAGAQKDASLGAVDFYEQDPAGLATYHFTCPNTTLKQLHIKVTDRQGNPAHIGRLHLWFKLLVTHG